MLPEGTPKRSRNRFQKKSAHIEFGPLFTIYSAGWPPPETINFRSTLLPKMVQKSMKKLDPLKISQMLVPGPKSERNGVTFFRPFAPGWDRDFYYFWPLGLQTGLRCPSLPPNPHFWLQNIDSPHFLSLICHKNDANPIEKAP